MDPYTLARLAGLVGGLCWVARFVAGGGGAVGGGLYYLGALLVAVALVAAGAGLVSTSATWLRAIVGVAFPLLVWSVLEVLHQNGSATTIDGVVGLVVAVVAATQLARSKPPKPPTSSRSPKPRGGERRAGRSTGRSTGSHAR